MKASEFWTAKGTNFMTPNVIKHIDTEKYMIEFSSGRGMGGGKIYGVSVAKNNGECDFDKSECFHSESEAIAYINELEAH